jgi:hypothetical protein
MMKSQEKFVVGVRLQPSASSELLNWVFTTTARAGDHVVALHFIDQAAIAGGKQFMARTFCDTLLF